MKRLVWFAVHDLITDALRRQKIMKKWPRAWKIAVIGRMNSEWDDISAWLMT